MRVRMIGTDMEGGSVEAHPVAAAFPMLTEDELKDLAEDIAANGLHHPVVTLNGQILDGRNRWAACELVGLTPDTVEYSGDDPIGFVFSENLHRRHMNKGQLAVAAARAGSQSGDKRWAAGGLNKMLSLVSVNQNYLSKAAAIVQEAPDLADSVLSGTLPLIAAYEETVGRRRATDTDNDKLSTLRKDHPDLADMVEEGTLVLASAEAEAKAREERKRQNAQAIATLFSSTRGMGQVLQADDFAAGVSYANDNGMFSFNKDDIDRCIDALQLIKKELTA